MPRRPRAALKMLRVAMRQCSLVRGLRAMGYLGTRLLCDRVVEHLLVTGDGVQRVRAPCSGCVLAELVRSSHVAGPPVLGEDGSIVFLVRDSRAARRVLERRREQLLWVEEIDYREAVLTPRQREVLRVAAEKGPRLSRLAESLGVSKPAALKLLRKSMEKLARLHAPSPRRG